MKPIVARFLLCFFLTLLGAYISCQIISNDLNLSPQELQNAFIGLAALSIPVLWNAHQRIIALRDKSADGYEKILNTQFYEKLLTKFEVAILLPTAFLVFGGLLLGGQILASRFLTVTAFTVAIPYLLTLHIWFDVLEKLTVKNLISFIVDLSPDDPLLPQVFKEVWQKSDDELFDNEKVYPRTLLEQFIEKIDLMLTQNHIDSTDDMVQSFLHNFDQRSQILRYEYYTVTKALFRWHKKIWELSDGFNNADYFTLRFSVDSLRREVRGHYYSNSWTYEYFGSLSDFINPETEANNWQYVKTFMTSEFNALLESLNEMSDAYSALAFDFPKHWKITYDLETKPISKILLFTFIGWAQHKIPSPKNFDKELDHATSELFSGTDPMTLSDALDFIFSPWGTSRVESFIKRRKTFGLASNIRTFSGENGERQWAEVLDTERETTHKLLIKVFPDVFSSTVLSPFLAEIASLESSSELTEMEQIRLRDLKGLFTGVESQLDE